LPQNLEHPEARPLPSWLLPLGGGLLAVGLLAGYLARALVVSSSTPRRLTPVPTQEAPNVAPVLAAAAPYRAARALETAASPPAPAPAPDREGLSAMEARDREVARVAASGPDPRNLTADAVRAGESWSRAVKNEGVDLRFDRWTCYRAGCVTDVRHAPELFERVSRAISRDIAFMGWAGEKLRSGPIEQPGGQIEVTWILYAPEEGEPALLMEPELQEPPANQDEKSGETEKR
jgi:hypothetical protein